MHAQTDNIPSPRSPIGAKNKLVPNGLIYQTFCRGILANALQNSFLTQFNISHSKNHSSGMTREREQHSSHLK